VVRSLFNQSHRPEHFLYLLARCVKAAIRYNANGEFHNTPDNRRKGAMPREMRARITGASSLLAGRSILTTLDYREVLAQCDSEDLIYMDPPYQGVCLKRDNRYAPQVDHGEFWDALESLNRRECRFIVSYDGRTGDKQHGEPMPSRLNLAHLELCAGRSTQATLLGQDHVTYESLYLSPALVEVTSVERDSHLAASRCRVHPQAVSAIKLHSPSP
jgi:DNA adenine methylase